MSASLSFDQAPPISVPLRFFLTAPLFGIVAGLVLAFSGGEALSSRWHPVVLGLTHLLVAGFLLQAMAGALFQFVPVVTGGNVRHPRLMAGLTHGSLSIGTPLLVLGFFTLAPMLFTMAAVFLGFGLLALVLIVGMALLQTKAQGATLPALQAAVFSLLITAILGVTLALTIGKGIPLDIMPILEAHQTWGLAGWALMLLAGVSWSVVPMFQITPPYPSLLTRSFVPTMLTALGIFSSSLIFDSQLLATGSKALLLLVAAAFAGSTLRIQAKRKRKTTDSTLIFFRSAMVLLLVFCIGSLVLLVQPDLANHTEIPVALGILLLQGVFASTVCGMLYKIVPFLVWLYLQSRSAAGRIAPNMNKMIPPAHSRRQMWCHLLSLALLLPSPWLPPLAYPAGLCLALSYSGLLWNLLTVMKAYRLFISQNSVVAGHPQS